MHERACIGAHDPNERLSKVDVPRPSSSERHGPTPLASSELDSTATPFSATLFTTAPPPPGQVETAAVRMAGAFHDGTSRQDRVRIGRRRRRRRRRTILDKNVFPIFEVRRTKVSEIPRPTVHTLLTLLAIGLLKWS